MVHRLRCHSDAVLIGRGTVVADDPSLTIRRVPWNGPQPLRVVLDPSLELLYQRSAETYQLFHDGYPTVLFYGSSVANTNALQNALFDNTVTCVQVQTQDSDSNLSLPAIVEELARSFSVKHLMVEGGPTTARRFLESSLIDRCLIVKAPISFQEPLNAGLSKHLLEKKAGLIYLGSAPSGVDTIEYWSRPGLPWPTETLEEWP
jgi:riboflavin-specific deaminase-like protein